MVVSVVPRRMTSMSSSSRLWSKAKTIPARYPLAFGVVLSGCKTSFSDLLVQKVVERKEKIDWRRNAAFATFGFVYLGGIQYALYVPIFGRLFPNAAKFASKSLRDKIKDIPGLCNLGLQTFLDQCVHHPLMYTASNAHTRTLELRALAYCHLHH